MNSCLCKVNMNGVMSIIAGNNHSEPSSNPGQGSLSTVNESKSIFSYLSYE